MSPRQLKLADGRDSLTPRENEILDELLGAIELGDLMLLLAAIEDPRFNHVTLTQVQPGSDDIIGGAVSFNGTVED